MASINPNTLTEPIYVRLTLEIAEEIRRQAIVQDRTQSSQIRFLLQKALRIEERGEIEETKQ
jgi:molybdopterin/thiamine biosynthesis adenylyltransferase